VKQLPLFLGLTVTLILTTTAMHAAEESLKNRTGRDGGDTTEPKADARKTSFKFSFSPGKAAAGYTQVSPDTAYTKERGFGFDLGSKVEAIDRGGDDPLHAGFCTGDKPYFFSVAVPEGNYQVTVTLGDLKGKSTTTVKAELRRLMLENVQTEAGKFETRTFTVNVRTPRIASGVEVRLKDREKTTEALAWDEKLTLEFNDARPCLCALEITKVDDAVTVYLLGDSTVCDQPSEPFASWGQMLPRFFKAGVAVANHAESGESLKSSLAAKRLDKVLSTLKEGDYLFIQYGHNDMKEGADLAFTSYKDNLKHFVAEAKKRGGIPVLVTPMNRRTFKGDTVTNSLGDYPDAVRQVAKEEKVALIDLHNMSKSFYEALGPEKSTAAFKSGDGTHHNNYGSYELAKCVVEGVKQNKLDLARFLADDLKPFDPSKPDPVDSVKIPASPQVATRKPDGN
jgi:lysophospholipase L1-like esterase